jgi:hypothetical protein
VISTALAPLIAPGVPARVVGERQQNKPGLTVGKRIAFRAIGERLRRCVEWLKNG